MPVDSLRLIVFLQPGVGRRVGKVHPVVADASGEPAERLLGIGQAGVFADPFPRELAVALVGVVPPPDDEDAVIRARPTGLAGVVEGGQQLAEGEVAGAAEDGERLHSPFPHSWWKLPSRSVRRKVCAPNQSRCAWMRFAPTCAPRKASR